MGFFGVHFLRPTRAARVALGAHIASIIRFVRKTCRRQEPHRQVALLRRRLRRGLPQRDPLPAACGQLVCAYIARRGRATQRPLRGSCEVRQLGETKAKAASTCRPWRERAWTSMHPATAQPAPRLSRRKPSEVGASLAATAARQPHPKEPQGLHVSEVQQRFTNTDFQRC